MGHLAVEDLKLHSFGQYIIRLKLSLIYVFIGKKLHYICFTNELYVSYLFRHSLRKDLLGYYYLIFTGMCYIITARKYIVYVHLYNYISVIIILSHHLHYHYHYHHRYHLYFDLCSSSFLTSSVSYDEDDQYYVLPQIHSS